MDRPMSSDGAAAVTKLKPTGDKYNSPAVSTTRWRKSQPNDIWFFVGSAPAPPTPLADAAAARMRYDSEHSIEPIAIFVTCVGSVPISRCRSQILVTAGVSASINTGFTLCTNSVGVPERSTHWSANSAVVFPCCSYAHQKPALNTHTAAIAESRVLCLAQTSVNVKLVPPCVLPPCGPVTAVVWSLASRPGGFDPPTPRFPRRDLTAPSASKSSKTSSPAPPRNPRVPNPPRCVPFRRRLSVMTHCRPWYVTRHTAIPNAALRKPASYPSRLCRLPATKGARAAPRLMPL